MEKRERNKKDVGAHQEASEGSASSSPPRRSKRLNKTTEVEEPGHKKRKTDGESSDLHQDGVQSKVGQRSMSSVKVTSINDLPPEVLTKILQLVDTRSLFKCRLVNRQWNSTSSGILHQRPEAFIHFGFSGQGFLNIRRMGQERKSLKDFIDCFKDCKDENYPFARFYFSVHGPEASKFYGHEDWAPFISKFRTAVKFLDLSVFSTVDGNYSRIFIEKFVDLLLNQLSNLEELCFSFSSWIEASSMKLFPSLMNENINVNTNTNTVPVPVPVSVPELPNLKVVHLGHSMLQKFPAITKDILNAAVNLNKIHLDRGYQNIHHIHFLLSLGKPFLVQNCTINVNDEFLSGIKPKHRDRWMLKFEELELNLDPKLFRDHVNCCGRWDVAELISILLKSSENSLRKLKLEPLGFLSGLQLPRFQNLRRLTLQQKGKATYSFLKLFPLGVRSLDIFPTVIFLDIFVWDWPAAFFPRDDSIPILPRVQTVHVRDSGFNEASVHILALMCPNLKNLQIRKSKDDSPQIEFLQLGRSIWTLMKQLKSLEVDLDVNLLENNCLALDSCFTGFSLENCLRLFEMREAKIRLEKWGSDAKIPEAELTAKREHPSILDMTDLKKLTITPFLTRRPQKGMDFVNNLTRISQQYAFSLMPHLTTQAN